MNRKTILSRCPYYPKTIYTKVSRSEMPVGVLLGTASTLLMESVCGPFTECNERPFRQAKHVKQIPNLHSSNPTKFPPYQTKHPPELYEWNKEILRPAMSRVKTLGSKVYL